MAKRVAEGILAGLRDAIAFTKGDRARAARVVRVAPVNVAAVRKKTGLNQREFARVFAIPFSTLCKWEQRARAPTGPARILLHVIDRRPRAVIAVARQVARRDPRSRRVSPAAAP